MTRQTRSLNGEWKFWKDEHGTLAHDALAPRHALTVRVPAPWQTHEELRGFTGIGWYQRTFTLTPKMIDGRAVILHFGAVDYLAEVWVNGKWVGEHEGGYLPFEFDVTKLVKSGANTVTVRAADVDIALRTAADALACDALGAVVLEVWGQARQFDLVASRKLTLAAQTSGVTGLVLRMAAEPSPSTAETRWIVRAAHSPPAASWSSAWGAPVFDAQLVRNRHGPVGRWIMEWKCDECLFRKPAAYPQPVAAAPAHRPHQAPARARQRRTG